MSLSNTRISCYTLLVVVTSSNSKRRGADAEGASAPRLVIRYGVNRDQARGSGRLNFESSRHDLPQERAVRQKGAIFSP